MAMRKSVLAVAWLVVAGTATATGLVAVSRSLDGAPSTTALVLVAIAAAALTVVGLGVLLLVASRDTVTIARSARDGARAVAHDVGGARSDLADVREAVDDLARRVERLHQRLDESSAATSSSLERIHDGVAAVDGRASELTTELERLAAGIDQVELDDARRGQDLALRLDDLLERVGRGSAASPALSSPAPTSERAPRSASPGGS